MGILQLVFLMLFTFASENIYRINYYVDGSLHSRSFREGNLRMEQVYFKDGMLAQETFNKNGGAPKITCYLEDGKKFENKVSKDAEFIACNLM